MDLWRRLTIGRASSGWDRRVGFMGLRSPLSFSTTYLDPIASGFRAGAHTAPAHDANHTLKGPIRVSPSLP